MELTTLASGSSGNCHILTENGRSLLLDVGIPFPRIKGGLGFDLAPLDGALVTHEHKDHAQAVPEVIRAGIPIYLSPGTAQALRGGQPHCAMVPDALGNLTPGNWIIRPFPVEHDAVDPVGFIIFHNITKEKVVYLTDTGFTKYVPVKPNHLIIECSYCEDILEANRYSLGERYLRMKMHHFGLNRVKTFLTILDRSVLKSIVLVHLSATNSDMARMISEIQEVTGRIQPVFIAQPNTFINLTEGNYVNK